MRSTFLLHTILGELAPAADTVGLVSGAIRAMDEHGRTANSHNFLKSSAEDYRGSRDFEDLAAFAEECLEGSAHLLLPRAVRHSASFQKKT